jgi:predicted small lipoprotein YifL
MQYKFYLRYVVLTLCFLVAACGQKGSLYIPADRLAEERATLIESLKPPIIDKDKQGVLQDQRPEENAQPFQDPSELSP